MRLVYIAGPFRAASVWDMEQNVRRAEELALQVWQSGMACICPHTNTRFFQGAADDQVWLDGNLEILARCDAVLMAPGWARSLGATMARAYAIDHQIPVYYSLGTLQTAAKGDS